MTLSVTPDDMATYLKVAVDEAQATLIISMVMDLAAAVVSPVPDTAKAVIITAVARALPNPSQASAMSMGGSSASWAPGGVYLTRQERLALRRAGKLGAGAFSVNVAPDAGKHYHDPLRPATLDDAETFALDQDLP